MIASSSGLSRLAGSTHRLHELQALEEERDLLLDFRQRDEAFATGTDAAHATLPMAQLVGRPGGA
jgi:hypothetical protein